MTNARLCLLLPFACAACSATPPINGNPDLAADFSALADAEPTDLAPGCGDARAAPACVDSEPKAQLIEDICRDGKGMFCLYRDPPCTFF